MLLLKQIRLFLRTLCTARRATTVGMAPYQVYDLSRFSTKKAKQHNATQMLLQLATSFYGLIALVIALVESHIIYIASIFRQDIISYLLTYSFRSRSSPGCLAVVFS